MTDRQAMWIKLLQRAIAREAFAVGEKKERAAAQRRIALHFLMRRLQLTKARLYDLNVGDRRQAMAAYRPVSLASNPPATRA